MAITINEALIKAGIQYRKDLLTMPVAALADILPYFSLQTGIQGKRIGGVLTTDAQMRPYKTDKGASDNTAITPYEMETFLGDVVKEFDPNALLGTLYTDKTASKPTEREIARVVALEMARKVGEALHDNMFSAIRDADGTTTADLFNGYSTQVAAAVTAGSMSVAKGNYADLSTTAISATNAGDLLKEAWRGVDKILKRQKCNLYLPVSVIEMYEDWYQVEHGSAPFNTGITQKVLAGSDGRCNLVPLTNMEDQDYMFITVRENMLIGVDQESDKETVRIRECDNPKLVQFFMMAYFGVGFDTIDKRYMKAIKFS